MMDTSPTGTSPDYGASNLGATTQSELNITPAPVSTPLSTVSRPSTAKAGARQITRNRASYSCHTCRRRKVKCNKVHPVCGNCVKNGTECVYDVAPQKDSGLHNSQARGGHGNKRRRESSRPVEDDIDDVGSLHGHLRQVGSSEQRYGSQAIEARLDKLTSMIERLSKTNGSLDAAQRHLLAPNVNPEAGRGESRPGNGTVMKPAGTSHPDSPRRADSSSEEFPIPTGHATDLVDPVGSLNLGHLSLEDGGRSRYVGTTYWAYISHEINELNQLLKYQNRSHNDTTANESSLDENMTDSTAKPPGSPWKASVDRPRDVSRDRMAGRETFQKSVLFPTGDSPSVKEKHVEPEMLDHMPTKRQSHVLYKGFMSGIHAISPVVHPPTILKLYNSFWDWYDYSSYSGDPCPDPSFIPLLYAIWYGGSVTISIRTIKAEFNVSSRSALSKTYSDEVTRWLTKISFPRSPSLQGLAAYLLVQTILSKEEEPLTSSLFISLTMRVAQTMGLHRDPAKFGIKPYEAEYRRRIWWHIVHMDGVVAMSSGLPPLVSDENYWDVRDASEVKDTLLGTPEAEKYEELVASGMRSPDNPDDPTLCGGPSMVNVYYLSARGKYIMARAVRRILKIQLGTKPVTRRDMEELRSILLDLQLKLNSIINRIPEIDNNGVPPIANDGLLSFPVSPVEMRTSDIELPGEGPSGCAEQYHSSVLISFHKWARILLSLFIDKAFCVAYQPFLKNAKSRIWPAARHSALRHCHGFMEKFVSLATDPEFQPFQWSWPGNHQPMHAAMIMLIDLYERPHSPEAPKSRAFVDKIFSLTGPDGGVVGGEDGISAQRPLKDGGREAWDMIRRLRQKAWQKAGLDPHKLWTEQAQIQAGAASGPDGYYPCTSNPYYANSGTTDPTPSISTLTSRQQLADFSKMFYNMTRSHMLPNPASTLRPSPLRYQLPQTSVPTSALPTPQISQAPAAKANLVETPPASTLSSPDRMSPLRTAVPFAQSPTVSTPPPPLSFMDLASPGAQSMAAGSTPPSMMDPSLHFDWDQWDAVFGQHLPVADELMELDPVAGFEFGDLGGGRFGDNSRTTTGLVGSPADLGSIPGPDWVGYC
ncbi:fungal-specific transcription factor domain-containing protein [Aspergillus coremiiformis]|uniref:Fungal-specific transcription factor domain-containing protein n=1 Tax=Aspergillus coremiiformis TaxID=138285 RepID=A0A5N6ZFH3_9EURO|nr:fungal-specific transcription factor domain-containing protein [Aspergillus coremiiformis]